MEKITVTDEKIFRLLTTEYNSHTDFSTSHAQLSGKGCQYKEEDSGNKIL